MSVELTQASELKQKLEAAVSFLKERLTTPPSVALFLGTGLGSLSGEMQDRVTIPYAAIPSFPEARAFEQQNALTAGRIGGKQTLSFEGRFHAYEGHAFRDIGFPVRVAHALGCRTVITTNIAGGINRAFKCGDLVLIEDHLNLMGGNPLVGSHEPWMGEKFLDLCEVYDKGLMVLAAAAGKEEGLVFKKGVYAAVLGPHLETKAEYRYLGRIGADLVGMSTVPEVLVARQLGMKVLAVSVVSDECDPDDLKPVSIPRLLEIAKAAQQPLTRILSKVIARSA